MSQTVTRRAAPADAGQARGSAGEIRPLTGIRGLASVFVALYHIHWQTVSSGRAWPLLRHGYLSVDLFFILSGYVLALTYRKRFERGLSALEFLDFLVRRLFRIWPAYVVVLAALLIAEGAHLLTGSRPSLKELAANLSLTQTWWQVRSLNEPTWSVSAELAAYFAFPLIMLGTRKVRSNLVSAGIVGLLICAVTLLLAVERIVPGYRANNGLLDGSVQLSVFPLMRCLLEFMVGVFTLGLGGTQLKRFFSRDGVFFTVAAVAAALLCIPGTDILFLVVVPPLLLCLTSGGRLVDKALGNRVVYSLGTWSYALYLIHYHSNKIHEVALRVIGNDAAFANVVSWIVQYAVLVAASAVIYKLIEKPGRRMGQKLASKMEHFLKLRVMPRERAKGAV